MQTKPQAQKRTVPADCNKILVNVHGKGAEELAAAFDLPDTSKNHMADELVETTRIARAEQTGAPLPRPGRGDDGLQVFGQNGLKNANLVPALRDLTAKDYVLVGGQTFETDRRERGVVVGKKRVTRFTFIHRSEYADPTVEKRELEAKKARMNPADYAKAAEKVERKIEWMQRMSAIQSRIEQHLTGAWTNCHVWANDASQTVNISGGRNPQCGASKVTQLRFSPSAKLDQPSWSAEAPDASQK